MNKFEVKENKELNGIEVYFEQRPCKELIDALKNKHFRWHNTKKCWYAIKNQQRMEFLNKLGKIETMENKKDDIANDFGIKVGDIFQSSWGYEQTNVDFFRVEKLRGKTQVVIRPVELKVKEQKFYTGGMACDRSYDINAWSYSTGYTLIKKEGEIRKIQGTKEYPYISINSYAHARKYTGGTLYESFYA